SRPAARVPSLVPLGQLDGDTPPAGSFPAAASAPLPRTGSIADAQPPARDSANARAGDDANARARDDASARARDEARAKVRDDANATAAYGSSKARGAHTDARPSPPSAAFKPPPPPPAIALELDGQASLSLDRAPYEAPPIELDRPPSAVSPPRARLGLAAALAALALIAGGWWLFASQKPPLPSHVRVQIIDLPPRARVFLDGNPAQPSFELAGDRVKHRLRLEARGHATRLLLFDATADQTIDGHLDRSE